MSDASKLEIVVDGDSWVFGCEILHPELRNKHPWNKEPVWYDHLEENDSYRIPKIFSTHLASMLDCKVTNLSWPADDNGTILRRTISYVTNPWLLIPALLGAFSGTYVGVILNKGK